MAKITARERLANSMKMLLHSESLHSLRVSEIVKDAGLSRQAFYQLFKDKYDLGSYIWSSEVNKLLREGAEDQSLLQLYSRFMTAMEADMFFYKNLLETTDEQNSFFYSWVSICMNHPIVDIRYLKENEDALFAMRSYAYGSNLCIRDWILQGCQEPPIDIARRLVLCIPNVLIPYISVKELGLSDTISLL